MEKNTKGKLSIIHMHLMKTAGMTLNHEIGNFFPDNTNLFKNQCEIEGYPSVLTTKQYFNTIVSKFDFIAGHFNYKLVQKIKRAKILQGKHVVDFTILRNPLHRTISIYKYYVKEFYTNPIQALKYHGRLAYELFWERKIDFEEFLELMPDHVDNFQTRFLSDLEEECMWSQNPPIINESIFENAKKNLETFSLIGLQEELEGFWKCLCCVCGWEYNKISSKINSSELKSGFSVPSHMTNINVNTITSAIRRKIEERTYYDNLLFEYGRLIYKKQIEYINEYFGMKKIHDLV